MPLPYELFIATRYLKAKRKQTFISLITLLSIAGVTVGVMALIVVIAVMSGAESDFRKRILGVESHILIMRRGGGFNDYQSVIRLIREQEGVVKASPFVYTQIMLRSKTGVSGALMRGIDPNSTGYADQQLEKNIFQNLIHEDEDEKTPSPPGIILGKELAQRLGVITGDVLYIISPKGMLSPIGHVPAMIRYQVVGTLESGLYEYDGALAYIHIKDAQKLMRMGDAVTGIGVWIEKIFQAPNVASSLGARLGMLYWTRTWMEMNQSLFSALKLEKTAMFIILTLIILVAAFNIASSLIMMVMDKTRDIAILKAMGASNKGIRRIFIANGITIGALGTTLGTLSGIVLCMVLKRYQFIKLPDVYPFSTLPIQLETTDVLLIGGSALLICFLATLYPAYQAAKMNPVEAIRYG